MKETYCVCVCVCGGEVLGFLHHYDLQSEAQKQSQKWNQIFGNLIQMVMQMVMKPKTSQEENTQLKDKNV